MASAHPHGAVTPGSDGANAPDWWEDDELAAAVADVEQFAGEAGWDRPPQLFALVETAELVAAQPELAGEGDGTYTPVAQDPLPTGDLFDALGTISWPPGVAGCVLVQEILVLPPEAA